MPQWVALKLFGLSLVVASLLGGCTRGLLYTDITSPLTKNFDETPVGQKRGESGTELVALPVGGVSLSGEWRSRASRDAATNGGISTISHADERQISVLGGLWKRRTVIAYGD